MIKWKDLVRLGKYFGVIDKKDANVFLDSGSEVFEFSLDQGGKLWVSSQEQEDKKKDKTSN